MTTTPFTPVDTQRASEAIYTQVRDRILSGELAPGDRLPSERELMDMFRRSRPTIREALRMLEQEGLLETRPGSGGAVVTAPTMKNMENPLSHMLYFNLVTPNELREYRAVNEVANAGWAAERRSDEELRIIESRVLRAESETDTAAIIRLDGEFHSAVCAACGNRVVSLVGEVFNSLMTAAISASFYECSPEVVASECRVIVADHRGIYEAIAARDAETARERMLKHILRHGENI